MAYQSISEKHKAEKDKMVQKHEGEMEKLKMKHMKEKKMKNEWAAQKGMK